MHAPRFVVGAVLFTTVTMVVPAQAQAAQAAQCSQAQAGVAATIEAARQRLEEARQTNSAAALRAVVDSLDAALADVRTQLAPCAQMPEGSAEADPHAVHPTTSAPGAPAAPAAMTTPQAAPAPVRAAPRAPAPAAADPHAGHAMPGTVSAPAVPTAPVAAASATPPTSVQALKCATAVDARTALRMLYQGVMYYFCSEQERAAFAKEPARFVSAPPAAAAPPHVH